MASTVGARTHYEILGLKPTATAEEIERAFAAEIGGFQPHTIRRLADVTVAHETLRDPAKRRDYDASIGLVPKQKPKKLLVSSGVGRASFAGSGFVSRVPNPVDSIVAVGPPAPEPSHSMSAQPEEATPFIAAALRELARPQPLNDPARVPWPQAELPRPRQSQAALDPEMSLGPDLRPVLDEQLAAAEEKPIPWKRTAIAAGGLVLGVVLIGAWAGWDTGTEAKSAVKVALPPPTTFTVADSAAGSAAVVDKDRVAEAPSRVVEEARAAQPKLRSLARSAGARPQPRLADRERQISELPQTVPGAPPSAASDTITATAPATSVAASMPLPNRVIARAIQRIGYPCGQVASAVPDAIAGVFTVTCTSGHSYQAAPVHGRYRFRRVSGR